MAAARHGLAWGEGEGEDEGVAWPGHVPSSHDLHFSKKKFTNINTEIIEKKKTFIKHRGTKIII